MTEFDNLKNRYVLAVQISLATNNGYGAAKRSNEMFHKYCENLVERSNYADTAKSFMKSELKLLKEAMSNEIERYYGR